MLNKVGWSFTPNNGASQIKKIVKTVLNADGGAGAVREMIEMIIKEENLEEEFLRLWQ